jgi:hypothetical protein
MRITRTLTIAIAIAALAAPAAQARPIDPAQRDMHASVAIAAAQESQRRPLGHAGDTDWNALPVTSPRQVTEDPAVVADDGGMSWSTIGIIGGALLAVGAIAAVAVRRSPRLRVHV